ncbi:MAG: hypothetical protein LC808_21975, partial [Actinobacteria bacterium]|nr:hypothetical protein [Actinomycetota bacterium]
MLLLVLPATIILAAELVFPRPAGAAIEVTAVSGDAYGVLVEASLGGSVDPPVPLVTLPAGGGGPITASSPGLSVSALTTGSMEVATGGDLGPTGGSASRSVVNNATVPTNPPQASPLFTASRLVSTCTADAFG